MLSVNSMAVRAGARQAVRSSLSIAAAESSVRSVNARSFSISSSKSLARPVRKVLRSAAGVQQSHGYATTTNPNPPLGKKNASNDVPSRVGLIGARGYTGQALIDLLNNHPLMDLRYVSSRELAGQELQGYTKRKIIYDNLSAEDVAQLDKEKKVDCWVMALPNGVAGPYIEALDQVQKDSDHKSVVVDLSADYRFTDSWTYGLPELTKRSQITGATRISNPGCYSTCSQLALAPLKEHLDGIPTVFGVSGYSGAGTKPSEKNDINVLRDNLLPYSLTGHLHEKEISHHTAPVSFIPHVASWFQGIHLTISIPLNKEFTSRDVRQLYQDRYAGERLVKIVGEAPRVRDIAKKHHVEIGGFAMDHTGKRVVITGTIDNLLKGAASQCLQNMNLALGYAEYEGIPEL